MSPKQLEAALQRSERDNHELRRELAKMRADRDRVTKSGVILPDEYTRAIVDLHDVAFYGAPRAEEVRVGGKPGSRPPMYDAPAYRRYRYELQRLERRGREIEVWMARQLGEKPLAS